jgi:PAS domain S-box-containing protein
MNDEQKTKGQLIEELTMLRQRVDELEKFNSSLKKTISEHRHKGQRLKEAEQYPSETIIFHPGANFAIDFEGTVIAWHKEMERMTGIKAEAILGKGNYEYALPFYGVRRPLLIDLILKPDEEIEKNYLFIKREGEVLLGESHVLLKGKPRVIRAKAKPLYDGKGKVIGAIESIADVTERKRMEETIRESEKRYQELVENINDVIYIIDHEGRITYISQVVEQVFGYHPSEVVDSLCTDYIFHEDLEQVRENLKIILDDHISPNEFRVYKKSGELCWVRTSSRPKYEKDRVTLQGVLTDIQDRKVAEELYKTLAHSSKTGVYIAQDGMIQFVNPYISKYSGYSENELIGMDVLTIVYPDDRDLVRKSAIEMLKGIRSTPYEFRMTDIKGSIHWLMGTVTAITYGGKPAILGNTIEITESKIH